MSMTTRGHSVKTRKEAFDLSKIRVVTCANDAVEAMDMEDDRGVVVEALVFCAAVVVSPVATTGAVTWVVSADLGAAGDTTSVLLSNAIGSVFVDVSTTGSISIASGIASLATCSSTVAGLLVEGASTTALLLLAVVVVVVVVASITTVGAGADIFTEVESVADVPAAARSMLLWKFRCSVAGKPR